MRYLPCEHVADTCNSCALTQAEARVAELEAVLRRLEWVVDVESDVYCCPDCGADKIVYSVPDGREVPGEHRPECQLAATLRAVPTGSGAPPDRGDVTRPASDDPAERGGE